MGITVPAYLGASDNGMPSLCVKCLAQGLTQNTHGYSNIIASLLVVLSAMTTAVLWCRGNQHLPFPAPDSIPARHFSIPSLSRAGEMEGGTVENRDHTGGDGQW